jgi:hypothetical protein
MRVGLFLRFNQKYMAEPCQFDFVILGEINCIDAESDTWFGGKNLLDLFRVLKWILI